LNKFTTTLSDLQEVSFIPAVSLENLTININNQYFEIYQAKLLNSLAGRILRLVAGIGFLVVGYMYRDHALGVISMVWGVLPLSAGAFDICYVSAALGGPLSGKKIRNKEK